MSIKSECFDRESCVISVEDYLTSKNSEEFKKIADEILGFGAKDILVDMDKLNVIDHDGLENLILTFSEVKKTGGNLILVSPKSNIIKVLQLTHLSEFITIV